MAFGFSGIDMEIENRRKAQAALVMPQIGPLLDAWHNMPGDVRGFIAEQCHDLGLNLDNISAAMEHAGD